MSILTAVITHLAAARTAEQLRDLRALSPGSRFVICHGGQRRDFEELREGDALYIGDPTLRGPNKEQSYNATLAGVYERFVRDDPDVELVFLIEYDHLILAPDFEARLAALASSSRGGLFAKYASPRGDTNWPHMTRYRHDRELNGFFARVSRREDHSARWGCLGTGMLFRRAALEAFCSVEDAPHAYLELLIPTLVHHLGFDVVDVDSVSDLYAGVRWRPPYTEEEAIAATAAGRAFAHPFKEFDAIGRIRQAAGGAGPAKSSAAGSASG